MKHGIWVAALTFASCVWSVGQQASHPSSAQKQENAASASKDTSGTSGDQITKPAGAKETTLTGCLSGPDSDGKFMLRSMSHRSGVEVLGSDALKNDAGAKVKLTGKWEAPSQDSEGKPGMQRFQVTKAEVMAKTCSAPSETSPVSKNKRQEPTTYNAPSSNNPK